MLFDSESLGWLVLLHQLPAKPPYLRVKVWRRLQTLGALPLKNAVHVLPRREDAKVAFHDLLTEITSSGGEAVLIEARLIAGQSDSEWQLKAACRQKQSIQRAEQQGDGN